MAAPLIAAKAVAKATVSAIQNPDKTKKMLIGIICTIVTILFLPAFLLLSISILIGEDAVIDENFNITETEVYQKIWPVYQEYMADITQQMETQAQAIRDEHTITVTIGEPPNETTEEICTVFVNVQSNYEELTSILSYLSVTDPTVKMGKKYQLNKNAILDFYNKTCKIEVRQLGNLYWIENTYLSKEEIANSLFTEESDKNHFLTSFDSFSNLITSSYLDTGVTDDFMGDDSGSGGAFDVPYCHPELIELSQKLISECEKQGLKIKITQTIRTVAQQDELYAQGRTKPGNIVTKAKGSSYSSMHQWGIAFDICRNDGQGAYNESGQFFEKVGEIGKSIGLEWGGDWTSIIDKPHFQLSDWGSTPTKLKAQYGNPNNFYKSWNEGE